MYEQLQNYLKDKTRLLPNQIAYACQFFELIKAKRNQILIDYDEICDAYYFINKGAARIFALNQEGLESVRYFAFANSFCTALPSFLDQNPSREYLQTIEKSELLKIKRDDFYKLIKELPELESMYRGILENAFIISQQRIYGFQGFDAQQKVTWVIKNQPEILLKISNKMAASYLGMSPSTLSRVKAKL